MMKSIAFNDVRENEDYVLVDHNASLLQCSVENEEEQVGDDDASYDYCDDAFSVPSAVPTLELDNDESVVVPLSSSGATSTESNRALLDDEFLQSVRELEIEFPAHLRVFSSSTFNEAPDLLCPINCSSEFYNSERDVADLKAKQDDSASSSSPSSADQTSSDCRTDSVLHDAAECDVSIMETEGADDTNNSSCNTCEQDRHISRKSNKKRRKQLKLTKKAAAAAAAAAALSQLPLKTSYSTPTKSRKVKVPNMPSRHKKQVANVAVSCATEAIALYKDNVLSRQKKIR